MGLTREEAYWNSELILLNYCIWQNLDNQAKETLIDGVHILIDQIYDAHEAELKAKDERIAELEAQIKAIKEYCREQIQAYDGPQTDVEYGLSVGYQNILNKIE